MKSPLEIKKEFCLDIIDSSKTEKFFGSIMTLPKMLGGDKKEISNISKTFPVYEDSQIYGLCIYSSYLQKDAEKLKGMFDTASKGYKISPIIQFKHVDIPEKVDNWKKLANLAIDKKHYKIIIVLIDDKMDQRNYYTLLKEYAQETKGFITQFIKKESLRKNGMSVVSNILIQMNTKLGGVLYKIPFGQEILKKDLMIVGVDSSGSEDSKGIMTQSISFCATTNADFTKYTNAKTSVSFEEFDRTNFPIEIFMESALTEYFKINKKFPGGVVIYRQGASKGEKQYLKNEISQLFKLFNGESHNNNEFLKGLKVPFYYITVNKKSSLKFFETEIVKNNINFNNPESGLLVTKKLVNPNRFEFYIQPQKVSQGTATPTCYQVDYGNLNCPEIVPKLTFFLCFLYTNWRGPVRVPAPLKYAEKLAKSKSGLNDDIKNSLSFI